MRAGSVSPFGRLRAVVVVIVGYAAVAAVWVTAGAALPGGRWFAVHLFTLGVLTNAVVAFSAHFAATLTRQPGRRSTAALVVLNAGIAAVLAGVAGGMDALTGVGAVLTTGAVMENYLRMRRQRRGALGARFGAVVRTYERAHGAFVHGALLGAALALGLIPGGWYVAVRTAHLHVNVLGWAGLTLLATVVFFGPTVGRTRIEQGADEAAAPALRRAATALTIAVVALAVSGVGGVAGGGLRITAALALATYAHAAGVVLLPAIRAVAGGVASVSARMVIAAAGWFLAAAWVDAVLVAFGAWWLLDAVGVAVLLGVLLQAVAATLSYIAPLLVRAEAQAAVRGGLEVLPLLRPVLLNAAVAAAVTAAALSSTSLPLAAIGWAVVMGALGAHVTIATTVALRTCLRPRVT